MADVFRIVLFLLLVNGLPPLAAILLHQRWERPIDGNRLCRDGQPLLGSHKTFRGLAAGILGGLIGAPLIGAAWWAGAILGLLAMIGDMLSSFIKRRQAITCGRSSFLLDQLFESLLPLLFANSFLPLTLADNLLVLTIFSLVAHLGSVIWRQITMRPLPEKYPRVVTSTVRFHEWRSCHTPLARWQVWFNLTSFLSDQVLLTWLFRITGLYRIGQRNALRLTVEDVTISLPGLPRSFDGYRILLLTDLHLDGMDTIDSAIIDLLPDRPVDLWLIGGDFRMKTYGDSTLATCRFKKLMQHARATDGAFGVLGNHDCIEMLPDLEDAGLVMLVNDAWVITRGDDAIWIAGVDDPHYYRLSDPGQACRNIPQGSFVILLAHSPESYQQAADSGASLYLCGHTHCGQICLRQGTPILTNSRAPRTTASGRWRHKAMEGYTSRGAAPSSIPVRFNCPGEITLITLRHDDSTGNTPN